MKAKEMFEALGYRKANSGNDNWLIRYCKLFRDEDKEEVNYVISFWGETKTYDTTEMKDNFNWGLDISKELHEAITQQMKELGWLE